MIDYSLEKSPHARGIRLKISPQGQVLVRAPIFASDRMIESFVDQHQPWILKNLAKLAARPAKAETEEFIYLFGQRYEKKIVEFQPKTDIKLVGNQLIITFSGEKSGYQHRMVTFLKKVATNYILIRTKQWAEKMHISYHKVSLKNTSSRWGSCSSRGNLNFNYRLVHAPPAVIDYVIIHELTHRVHMNHSAKFWNLVKTFDPAYRLHQAYLKNHLSTF